jgi:hypothetical protein
MPFDAAPLKPVRFRSEAHLVRRFVQHLKAGTSPWGQLQSLTEWDYGSGQTDVLARDQDRQLIAFEAKLFDWRHACVQAYRNTTFADRAYVVLPEPLALRVQSNETSFTRFGVGLCSCGSSGLRILIEAKSAERLMDWLATSAHSEFDRKGNVQAGLGGRRRPRLQAA